MEFTTTLFMDLSSVSPPPAGDSFTLIVRAAPEKSKGCLSVLQSFLTIVTIFDRFPESN
jgi:hypothetical protein